MGDNKSKCTYNSLSCVKEDIESSHWQGNVDMSNCMVELLTDLEIYRYRDSLWNLGIQILTDVFRHTYRDFFFASRYTSTFQELIL